MQLLDRFQMRFRGGLSPRTEVQGYTISDVIPVAENFEEVSAATIFVLKMIASVKLTDQR
jgi:hypothetical protein